MSVCACVCAGRVLSIGAETSHPPSSEILHAARRRHGHMFVLESSGLDPWISGDLVLLCVLKQIVPRVHGFALRIKETDARDGNDVQCLCQEEERRGKTGSLLRLRLGDDGVYDDADVGVGVDVCSGEGKKLFPRDRGAQSGPPIRLKITSRKAFTYTHFVLPDCPLLLHLFPHHRNCAACMEIR